MWAQTLRTQRQNQFLEFDLSLTKIQYSTKSQCRNTCTRKERDEREEKERGGKESVRLHNGKGREGKGRKGKGTEGKGREEQRGVDKRKLELDFRLPNLGGATVCNYTGKPHQSISTSNLDIHATNERPQH